MTSKTFISGTVIDSNWLNDVDKNTYGPTAPAGTLRGDLSTSSGASFVGGTSQVVSSIVGLRALLKTSSSKNAFATGYYTEGDGGGGPYYYDAADTTTVDNGGTVIVASDGGRWKSTLTGAVDFRMFGVKMDNATDNTVTLGNLIAYLNTSKRAGYCPPGVCLTAGGHVLTSGFSIVGDSSAYNTVSRIKLTASNVTLFAIGEGVTRVCLERLELASASSVGTTAISCQGRGSTFPSSYEHLFRNCTLRGFNIAALFESTGAGGGNTSWQIDNIKFDHCLFTENNFCAYHNSDNADNVVYDHCKFYWSGANVGVQIARGGFPTFNNCISGGTGTGSFVSASGIYEMMVFNQCQVEQASYFLQLAGNTANSPVPIVMNGCGIDCVVAISSPAKLLTQGCRINSTIYLGHAAASWQSVQDQRDVGYAESIAAGFKFDPGGTRKFTNYAIGTTQLTIAHGLGYVPTKVHVISKSNSNAWESQASDATNIYLTSSVASNYDIHVG